MKSALYDGVVTHRRYATEASGHVAHDFRYALTLPLVFLDEFDQVAALHPRCSARRFDLVWLRRRDYLGGDRHRSLDTAVREEVLARTGRKPAGDIALLGHVRRWGWLFNPLCVFYCFDESGEHLDQVLLEVRNTPWHQRHLYAFEATSWPQRFAKEMHVSPFLGMDHEYVATLTAPTQHLSVHLGNRRGDERIFDASMSLTRREMTSTALGDLAWHHPLATMGVSAGIYRQALALWRKRAPFHGHPSRSESAATLSRQGLDDD